MLDVTVAIPWRPQPDRLAAHRRVVNFWHHHNFQTIHADSDPDLPFSLAEARNNAVRQITTPRVIVADADSIPDIGAVHTALNTDGVTWPFTEYRHIPGEYADKPDLMTAPIDRTYRNSAGGCFTCTTETYWQLGGMDERLQPRWGYDDTCFRMAANTLSTVHRIPGILFSFNHAADRDTSTDNPNRHRWELYKFANGQPHIMRELIKR